MLKSTLIQDVQKVLLSLITAASPKSSENWTLFVPCSQTVTARELQKFISFYLSFPIYRRRKRNPELFIQTVFWKWLKNSSHTSKYKISIYLIIALFSQNFLILVIKCTWLENAVQHSASILSSQSQITLPEQGNNIEQNVGYRNIQTEISFWRKSCSKSTAR